MTGRFFRTVTAVLFLLTGAAAGYAQVTEDQQSRKARLEKEIAILDKQLKQNASQSASATSRLTMVQRKIKARQDLIKDSDRQIEGITASIRSKERQIDVIQNKLDTMNAYYTKLVKNAYKNRDARKWYMYILASQNISQGVRRYAFFRDLSKEMNAQARKIKEIQDNLKEEKARLEEMQKEAAELRSQRVADLGKLKAEEADAKKISAKLKKEKTKYQKELSDKKRKAAALEKEIRRAIAEAMGGESSSGKKKAARPIDYTLAGEFAANKGKLPWPVEGPVVARFGKQYHPVFKSLQLPANNGITIATSAQAPVCSVFNGVVAQITVLPGYHQCILVQHGNFFTLYSKIKTANVKAGDKVKTGQEIGTVDTINGETVFHFEIWDEKTVPQNPETWLRPR